MISMNKNKKKAKKKKKKKHWGVINDADVQYIDDILESSLEA